MKELSDIYDQYYTIEQVANFMNLSVKALKNRICAGKNHPPVIRGLWKFRKEAFHGWIEKLEAQQLNKVS